MDEARCILKHCKWAFVYLMLFLCLWLCAFLLVSCQSKNSDAELIVKKWKGKEIVIPDDGSFVYTILGNDTILGYNLWDKPHKIVTYIDSIGCSICQLEVPLWNSDHTPPENQ